jgi:Uma2 family endonuclease
MKSKSEASMSTITTPPLSFYGPTPEGFPPPARLSVAKYEAMLASGAFTKDDRFELIEGTLVAKMTKKPRHSTGSELCGDAVRRLLPPGWHVRIEKPVRIPARDSVPEPDISVARGQIRDYEDRDPAPEDVALVVEVSDTTLAADRVMALTYGGGGIPVYWIVNVADRQLEVYTNPAGGAYPAPTILGETETVDLIIEGVVVGRIAVADLLPRLQKGGA